MSNRQEVIVTISPTGKVTVETSGFKGKQCLDVLKGISLGEVKDIKMTNEAKVENRERVVHSYVEGR